MIPVKKCKIDCIEFLVEELNAKEKILSSMGYWNYIHFKDKFKEYQLFTLSDGIYYVSYVNLLDIYDFVFTIKIRKFD